MSSGASPWWEPVDLKGLIDRKGCFETIARFRSTSLQDPCELWRRVVGGAARWSPWLCRGGESGWTEFFGDVSHTTETYMSPFWNHILAKKDRFIHVRSQISWYVCSMYLGAKGNFFFIYTTLCALLPRCCVLLCKSFHLRMYRTIFLFP